MFIGDSSVGKTSIIKRYVGADFEYSYIMTLGVEEYVKSARISYKGLELHIKWHIWDIAGHAQWFEVRKAFYRGAAAAVIVYDIANPSSFRNVDKWAREMIINSGKRPMVLVGNKIDLRGSVLGCLTNEDGLKKAKELSNLINFEVPYIEVSAKNNININTVFLELGRVLINYAMYKIKKKI